MRLYVVRHPVPASDGIMDGACRAVGQGACQERAEDDEGHYSVSREGELCADVGEPFAQRSRTLEGTEQLNN